MRQAATTGQDKSQQLGLGLKLIDPQTASKPISEALALLPGGGSMVFRALANAELCTPTSASTCCNFSGQWSSTKPWNG